MGLPLFVAPVETDVPAKQAPKHDVLSPARSAIRRAAYIERRDRRYPYRRTAEQPSSAPGREALRDVTSGGERPRGRLEEQMSSLYGGTWHSVDPQGRAEEGGQEGDLGWWSSDLRPRARHARIAVISNPRRSRSPLPAMIGSVFPGSLVSSSRLPPPRLLDGGLERIPFETSTSLDDGPQASTSNRYRSLRRNQSRMYRALLSGRTLPNDRHTRPPVDGLGDRDRSLSPEGWDTLRSTLTPDPQPPSAGSSFASAAATHGAGPSNPPPTAPELPDEAMDPACESGHENSDDEDTYFGYPGYRGIRRAHQRINQLIPEYNLDGPTDGPRAQRTESSGSSGPGQTSGDILANHYSQLLFGQTSHAGSEDERRADRLRPNREGSAGSGPSTHTGDEEWLGMQRIVRNLAAREDIPDEWWAGAGLNRTLPREGPN
ncbi:hypothetical protein GGI43DRAFT_398912 [Trichoderma evansii]